MVIYFVTIMAMLGSFDRWLLAPFTGWLLCYGAALWYFVPRLGKVAKAQADARSLMTGRITDAYTNIATVKLFSHSHREAGYARSAMQEFLGTVHAQMRLVTAFEIVNHALSMLLIASTTGAALWLWTQGQVGVGALAAATAMALRLNGISHWVMWEMAVAVRAHRHGAGRHQHAEPAARGGRPRRRAAAEGDAGRRALRARQLRLRRHEAT